MPSKKKPTSANKRNRGKPAQAVRSSAQGIDTVYSRIQSILAEARARAWQAVNSAMVAAYWEIGRIIVEEEQQGSNRAEYGQRLVDDLSVRLQAEFGKGFDRSNLFHMRSFYLCYPIVDALR